MGFVTKGWKNSNSQQQNAEPIYTIYVDKVNFFLFKLVLLYTSQRLLLFSPIKIIIKKNNYMIYLNTYIVYAKFALSNQLNRFNKTKGS